MVQDNIAQEASLDHIPSACSSASARVDFDQFDTSYQHEVEQSIAFIRQSHDFFCLGKATHLLSVANLYLGDLNRLKTLDIGCGVGLTDRHLVSHFAEVHGIDVGPRMIRRAASLNPRCHYKCYDGRAIPYADDSFDVSFAICVLHHVPTDFLNGFVLEMTRVTKPRGLVIIMEHNPINPLTRLAVSRCKLDDDALLLLPSKVQTLLSRCKLNILERRYLFFTPFSSSIFRKLDKMLSRFFLGAQYCIVGQKQL